MKNRGKYGKTEQPDNTNLCSDFNYLSCKKHPTDSYLVGICAYCLNEKLIKLVCSDCGEQRMSSCSCSDFSLSYRNSSCTFDLGSVGSVGRISFLIENEKNGNSDEKKSLISCMKLKQSRTEETEDLLKRSNSCVVEVKKRNGFWKIGKLFKNKKEKDGFSERNKQEFDQKSDVSRSRSLLSSFMDGNFDHGDLGSLSCSSEKVSDFNEFESRFKDRLMDPDNKILLKQDEFCKLDDYDDDNDDEFIELKIDLVEKTKTEHSVFNKNEPLELIGDGVMGSSSCRITVNERGIKKVKNNHVKSWKWMFKHHSAKKKNLNHILKT